MSRSPCVFITFDQGSASLSMADRRRLGDLAKVLAGVTGALAFVPVPVEDEHPFTADGAGPALVLELEFENAAAADALLGADSALAGVLRAGLPSLPGAVIASQRMQARRFPVPPATGPVEYEPCTLLVDYPGQADDLTGWLAHYDAHHPAIMARFPKIRDVATFWPASDALNHLPGGRHVSMQRNKVVFDSTRDLVAALASPVMAEMRADLGAFPSFSLRPKHHPMTTLDLLGARADAERSGAP